MQYWIAISFFILFPLSSFARNVPVVHHSYPDQDSNEDRWELNIHADIDQREFENTRQLICYGRPPTSNLCLEMIWYIGPSIGEGNRFSLVLTDLARPVVAELTPEVVLVSKRNGTEAKSSPLSVEPALDPHQRVIEGTYLVSNVALSKTAGEDWEIHVEINSGGKNKLFRFQLEFQENPN